MKWSPTIRIFDIVSLVLLVLVAGCSEPPPLDEVRTQELSSTNQSERETAAKHFSANSVLFTPAVDPLIKVMIEDSSVEARKYAVIALGQIDPEGADPHLLHKVRVGLRDARKKERDRHVILELDQVIEKVGPPDPNYTPPQPGQEGEPPKEE